ncbi:MAG: MBL fold metallo-hydrolase [Opitutus sp.]|nr:MBL fold metallo-hydrolase [Opitutus sp.]
MDIHLVSPVTGSTASWLKFAPITTAPFDRHVPPRALIALLLATIAGFAAETPPAPRYFDPAQAFKPTTATVVLLGTGMPVPNPDASGPATAIVMGDRVLLFDAGPGTMRRIAAAGLPINGLTAVFLTHLHTDHTLGYPDVIFTTWVMGRRTPLRVFGPTGLRRMTEHLLAAWSEDIDVRINGLERNPPGGFAVTAREIGPGVVFDESGVRVTAFAVPHGNWKKAFGYRIDTPERSIVISGDTAPSEELARAAKDCDLLIHEAYPAVRLNPEARPGGDVWPLYMKSFHTSDEEVGAIASRAGIKKLILHHLVRMAGTDEELLAGVRRGGFKGEIVIGRDLDRH